MNVGGVMDYNLRFTAIQPSFPGQAHDSHVFQETNIFADLKAGAGHGGRLVGDKGYSSKDVLKLIVPEKNKTLTEAELLYNSRHLKTRNAVERGFGVWKSRFRILFKINTKVETAKDIIVATAVLHNILASVSDKFKEHDCAKEAIYKHETRFIVDGPEETLRDRIVQSLE